MTLQLLHSEFPYICKEIFFFFFVFLFRPGSIVSDIFRPTVTAFIWCAEGRKGRDPRCFCIRLFWLQTILPIYHTSFLSSLSLSSLFLCSRCTNCVCMPIGKRWEKSKTERRQQKRRMGLFQYFLCESKRRRAAFFLS